VSIDSLVSVGYILVGIGGVLAIVGLVLTPFAFAGIDPAADLETKKKKPLVRLCMYFLFGGGAFLGFAVVVFIASASWWLLRDVIQFDSPGQLAMYSLILGPLPLVFPLAAEIITRAIGGRIGANGYSNCLLWGVNVGPLLQNMLMFYLLLYVTGGLAVYGLLASGIWALIRAL
jgi:hypothetical protein